MLDLIVAIEYSWDEQRKFLIRAEPEIERVAEEILSGLHKYYPDTSWEKLPDTPMEEIIEQSARVIVVTQVALLDEIHNALHYLKMQGKEYAVVYLKS
jgi:hypothetical protein